MMLSAMEFERQSQSEIDTDTDTVRPLKSCVDSSDIASPAARVAARGEFSENLQNRDDESLRIEQSEMVRFRPVIADVGEWITQREHHLSVDHDEIETNPTQNLPSTLLNKRNVGDSQSRAATEDGVSTASKELQNGENGSLISEQSETVRSGPVADVVEQIMQREPYSAVYINDIEKNPVQNSPPTSLNEQNVTNSESMAATESGINPASKKLQNSDDGSLRIEQTEMLHSGPVADAGERIIQREPHSDVDLYEIEANLVANLSSTSLEEHNIANSQSTTLTGIGTDTASENLRNWDDESIRIEQPETLHSEPVTDIGEWIMQREPYSAIELDESEEKPSSPVQNLMSASLNEHSVADPQPATNNGISPPFKNLQNWNDGSLEIEHPEMVHFGPAIADVGEWIMQREPQSAVNIEDNEGNRSSLAQISSTSSNERDNADPKSAAAKLEEPCAVVFGGQTTVIGMPSPPVQAMERPESYDPFRIPSSVFERSGASPGMEWSIASNESLFSIHVGNTSFSRDHYIPLDLVRSGELAPTAVPAAVHADELEITEEANEERLGGKTVDEVARLIGGRDRASISPTLNSQRHSGLSYGSDSSARSFAFPLLPEGVSLQLRPEAEKLHRPEASPGSKKTSSKPWLPGLAWCCCSFSLCAWPRNCPSCCCCSWVRSCSCSSFRRSCRCCSSSSRRSCCCSYSSCY